MIGSSDGMAYEDNFDYLIKNQGTQVAENIPLPKPAPPRPIEMRGRGLTEFDTDPTDPVARRQRPRLEGGFSPNEFYTPSNKELLTNPEDKTTIRNLPMGTPLKLDDKEHETMLIIRHGATDYNLGSGAEKNKDYIRGHLDVPLNEQGRQEAADIGESLKDKGINKIVTSDLSRARDTAQAIGEATGAKIYVDHRLRPWDLGDFQGKNFSDCKDQIEGYCLHKPDEPVPNGESFNQFKQRASDALIDAAQMGANAVVTHHRVDRLEFASEADGFNHDKFMEKGEETGKARPVDKGDMIERLIEGGRAIGDQNPAIQEMRKINQRRMKVSELRPLKDELPAAAGRVIREEKRKEAEAK